MLFVKEFNLCIIGVLGLVNCSDAIYMKSNFFTRCERFEFFCGVLFVIVILNLLFVYFLILIIFVFSLIIEVN